MNLDQHHEFGRESEGNFREDMRTCGLTPEQTSQLAELGCSSPAEVWSYIAAYQDSLRAKLGLSVERFETLSRALEVLIPTTTLKALRGAMSERPSPSPTGAIMDVVPGDKSIRLIRQERLKRSKPNEGEAPA